MKKLILSALCAFLCLSAFAEAGKYVIVVSPYTKSDAWSSSMLSPLMDIESSYSDIDVDFITMDVSTLSGVDDYDARVDGIVRRACGRVPDLILVSGAQSYVICEDFDRIWPDVPIVVTGNLDYICSKEYVLDRLPKKDTQRTPLKELRPRHNFTLVQTPLYFRETLNLMKEMKPQLKEVIFIGGEDLYSREAQLSMQAEVEADGLTFTAVTPYDMTFDNFVKFVNAKDPAATAVLFKSCYTFNGSDFYRSNIEDSMPVFYMHYMTQRGQHGGLGYVSYSFEAYEAYLHSTLCSVLFDSMQPRDIPFKTLKPENATVNVACCDHYGISRKNIPGGATLENVPAGLWDLYGIWFVAGCCGLVLLAVIIAFALVLRSRNRQIMQLKERLELAGGDFSNPEKKQ